MGLFWLFLFRFRNNKIHGISISKRTLLHDSDLDRYFQPEASRDRRGRPRRISRQKFPKRTGIMYILSKPHSFHSVHSAIGSRMNGMIFRSFRKRNISQNNTNTVYSEYSYSGIVPKERALSFTNNSNHCPMIQRRLNTQDAQIGRRELWKRGVRLMKRELLVPAHRINPAPQVNHRFTLGEGEGVLLEFLGECVPLRLYVKT